MKPAVTVQIKNLTTGYTSRHGSTVITREVNASLLAGELTCLLGPNGAGKSTLLKTLSGFLPPLHGDILIDGCSLAAYKPAQLAGIIGVVLTERVSLDNMTVRELVSLGRSPYTGFWGKLSDNDNRIVDNAISLVGIGDFAGRMVNTLSDGERQKVMIAKALAQETPIIFLDEPSAFLDYPSKVEIMQLLRRLARDEGKTVFLSTHDLELALQIADRAWLIDKVHGVVTGTPEDLALSGQLEIYFKRDGVAFDIETGLFKIDNRLDRSIRLSGDGAAYNMVRRALARRGIDGCRNCSSSHLIEILPDGYLLDSATMCHTISELLDNIASIDFF